jgi:hypothetical protein
MRSIGSDVVNDFIAHLLINKNVKWSANEKAETLPPQFLKTCSMYNLKLTPSTAYAFGLCTCLRKQKKSKLKSM